MRVVRPFALLALCSTLVPDRALAYDLAVEVETVGQGYQIAAADGSLIDRRRLQQYLGLSLWNFGPKDALGAPMAKNQWSFTMSLRLNADFGNFTVDQIGLRNVRDELGPRPLDLLFAYATARDLAGFIDLKLGRQVQVDQFEFLSFDGATIDVKTPYWFGVEAWGGLKVTGALPFDSPLYRADGTSPSAISTHDTDWKPTVGAALHSFGVRDLDARLSYRRTFSPAQNSTPAELATGATDGTSEEKLAWSLRGRLLRGRLLPWLGLRYNLLLGALDQVQAGARWQLSDRHALQAEYLYSYPTFDGDSIWNLFVRHQFDDVRAGYDLRLGAVALYARGFVRLFHETVALPTETPPAGSLSYGGTVGGRLGMRRGFVRADAYLDTGYGGQRIGFDAATRMQLRDWIGLEGRLTYVHFEDDLRPIDHGDSLGAQLGARVEWRGLLLHLIAEDNINRYYNSQFRLYAVIDFGRFAGTRGVTIAPARGVGATAGQWGGF